MKKLTGLLTAALLIPAAFAADKEYRMYVGTYTRATPDGSKGIYAYKFNATTGALVSEGLVAEYNNPSFITLHPNKKFLYSVSETNAGKVAAFAIDAATGKLTKLNEKLAKGDAPCHVALDRTNKNLIVANYTSGNFTSYPINADGSLGEPTASVQHTGKGPGPRQTSPHAHEGVFSADNKFAMIPDLGLDQVKVYKFDEKKGTYVETAPAVLPPNSGPRHMAFHPSNKYAYVINEIASTVTSFQYNKSNGAFTAMDTLSTLPAGPAVPGNSTAEIMVHPSGKFVYGSNRGHNSIVTYKVDAKTGKLTFVDTTPTEGRTPRNFAIDPTGAFMIVGNQDTNTMNVFKIDPASGKLTKNGALVPQPAPVSIEFVALK